MRSRAGGTRSTARPLPIERAQRALRVLLVEDNAVNQIAARLLRRWAIRPKSVATDAKPSDAWRPRRFDLILMDCQMPVLDGYEATREIRKHEHAAAAQADHRPHGERHEGRRRECNAAGMDDYLGKPLDRERLARCLDLHLPSRPL